MKTFVVSIGQNVLLCVVCMAFHYKCMPNDSSLAESDMEYQRCSIFNGFPICLFFSCYGFFAVV